MMADDGDTVVLLRKGVANCGQVSLGNVFELLAASRAVCVVQVRLEFGGKDLGDCLPSVSCPMGKLA